MAKEKPVKKQESNAVTADERKEIIAIISRLAKISEDAVNKNSNVHFADSGIDSFALVEIVFEIENKFNISIPQDSLVSVKNVEDLIGLIGHLRRK
jgi:acyl carrier protein